MGYYQKGYLGPYITAVAEYKTKQADVFGCTNPQCGEYAKRKPILDRSQKFCASCGNRHGTTSTPVTYRDGPYDIVGECLTEIPLDLKGGSFMMVPNVTIVCGRNPFFRDSDRFYTDLSSFDWRSEVKWFEDTYADPILNLQNNFSNLQVGWGIIVYAA